MYNARSFHGLGWVVAAAILTGLGIARGAEDEERAFSKYVDAKGNISLPDGFATDFVPLGSIAVAPKTGADVAELHATYTRHADLHAFQREGHFADGAVLVKEVRATQAEDLPTGHTRFAAGVKVWFVMIKDSKTRFPDNALWGDGWGWALFNGKDPKKQVATDYETDCRSCHIPARKTDWVYTQCYPLLQKQEAAATTSEADTGTKPDLLAKFPQWQQALQLQGNADRGRTYFESKVLNTSMTCASCHSFDRRDTPSVDADGLRRAGSSIFGAAHRTNIKKSGTNLVALGGNVCVIHFMKGEEPGMNAQELADLDSFLKAGGGADHPSAKNIDYASLKWTLPERLAGGDARKGAALAGKTCITCHGVDGKKSRLIDVGSDLDAGSYQATDLRKLALRIRNPQYKQDQEMPGYSDLRLSNEELVDLLAWLTTKP